MTLLSDYKPVSEISSSSSISSSVSEIRSRPGKSVDVIISAISESADAENSVTKGRSD